MPTQESVVQTIARHLESKSQDVVDVLAGPRREGWFNAEMIVALSRKSCLSSFVAHGEQGYRMVLQESKGRRRSKDRRRIPDGVVYSPEAEPTIVIETKLVYRSDSAGARDKALQELITQLKEARQRCPRAARLGIFYLVCRSNDKPGKNNIRPTPESFTTRILKDVDSKIGDEVRNWVQLPKWLKGLQQRRTSFEYPSLYVWLGIAAVEI